MGGNGFVVSKIKKLITVLGVCALLSGLSITLESKTARADDPDFVSIGAGWFDWNRQKDVGGEFRLEYRSNHKWWVFKPFLTAAATNHKMSFLGMGVLIDIHLGRRLVLTPSFAPTWWRGETEPLDLGYPLEFRSQMELAWRFNDRSRLGVAISHYSNASIGDSNPGTETLSVYYSIPLNVLFPPD